MNTENLNYEEELGELAYFEEINHIRYEEDIDRIAKKLVNDAIKNFENTYNDMALQLNDILCRAKEIMTELSDNYLNKKAIEIKELTNIINDYPYPF